MKMILLNIAALFCAVAIFGGSVVYSASIVPVVDTNETSSEVNDDFLQQDDLFIADLLSGDISSEDTSSMPISSEPILSEISSSKPTSSKVVSSIPTPSKPTSSKVVSSIPVSSEVISNIPPTIEGDYADILDTLAGAVQREIIGGATNPAANKIEAYKAQAVASHSYMEYHKARTGEYPTMSYCTPKQATIDLVAEVLNELVYYDGSVINASYHAASGGHTQSVSYVWGYNAPYLIGVESKYDDYDQQSGISIESVRRKLENYGITVSDDPSTWFDLSGTTFTDGNFIDYITICGTLVKGRTLRENIIGSTILKSPKIVDISVSGDNFIFTTKGYGHGVGFSQNGALGYAANDGWDYKTILTHYYSGTVVK